MIPASGPRREPPLNLSQFTTTVRMMLSTVKTSGRGGQVGNRQGDHIPSKRQEQQREGMNTLHLLTTRADLWELLFDCHRLIF